jgi:protocatechuate 3,4-dioxygenase beta subunit
MDPQGRPAGAARVYVTVSETPGLAGDREPEPARTTAAADGSFRLELPALGKRAWATVVAVKDGSGPGGQSLEPGSKTHDLALYLTDPAWIGGQVVDPAGRPVAVARVRVLWGSLPNLEPVFAIPDAAAQVVTDARGRFRLGPLPARSEVSLAVDHPGYARWSSPREGTRSGAPDVRIALRPAGSIEGRVVGPDGQPTANVPLHCQPSWPPVPNAITDASGSFHFDRMAAGAYVISPDPAAAPAGLTAEPQRVEVREGAVTRCPEFRLERLANPGVVTGKVTDAATGQPVAGVLLYTSRVIEELAMAGLGIDGPTVETGADGTYRLPLPPGKYWHLYPSSFPPFYFTEPFAEPPPAFAVVEGQRVTKDFTVHKAVLLRGKILDASGQPAAGAMVRSRSFVSVKTDLAGQYVIPLLPPERLTMFTRDFAQGAQVPVAALPASGERVVRLQRLPRLTGRVTDDGGAPIPMARVRVDQMTPLEGGMQLSLLTGTAADDQGRFSVAAFPGITCRVSAEANGFAAASRFPVELEPGKPPAPLALALARALGSISGVVIDPDGKPMPGVQVAAWRPDRVRAPEPPVRGTTDGQGRFRIDHLPAGEVSVSASRPGYFGENRARVKVGTANLHFMLAPMEPAAVRVPSPIRLGAPAPEIPVSRWINGPGVPSLAALRGKTVVLQFSSAYNGAARASNAALQVLQARLNEAGRRDVVILGLYDSSASAPEAEAYARTEGLPFPIGIVPPVGNAGPDSGAFPAYGVLRLPTVVVLDKEGIVRALDPDQEMLLRLSR